jgi:hypothetical protein
MKKKPWNRYSNTLKFRKTYLEQQLDKQTTNTSIMQPDIFLTVKHQQNVSDICAICSQKPIRQAPQLYQSTDYIQEIFKSIQEFTVQEENCWKQH